MKIQEVNEEVRRLKDLRCGKKQPKHVNYLIMVNAYLALKLACESLKKGYNKKQIYFSMAIVSISVSSRNAFCIIQLLLCEF